VGVCQGPGVRTQGLGYFLVSSTRTEAVEPLPCQYEIDEKLMKGGGAPKQTAWSAPVIQTGGDSVSWISRLSQARRLF
jgi:hypothetical protein